MGELAITWQTVLGIAGGIVVLANGARALASLTNPQKELRKRVDRHDELLARDNERLKQEEACTRATMSALLALLEHAITGNSVDKLKAAKDRLQGYLIEKNV